jgi:hypothetical protein
MTTGKQLLILTIVQEGDSLPAYIEDCPDRGTREEVKGAGGLALGR